MGTRASHRSAPGTLWGVVGRDGHADVGIECLAVAQRPKLEPVAGPAKFGIEPLAVALHFELDVGRQLGSADAGADATAGIGRPGAGRITAAVGRRPDGSAS
jgi:hypothetical protein